MLPHLPQELIDSIVDNLHDDKRALASASMISTTWLPSCQSHLFHSIYMKRMLNQGYNDFVDFLESTPVVSGYIKYLHLKGEFRTPVLVRLLGCLNRLTSLKIQGIFLSVKPVVLPFPPVKLDFLLVELIYNINYPSYPVAEIVKKGAEEDIWEQDEENHRDSSGEEDWDSRVNDPSEEESEVEDDEGTDEGMDGGVAAWRCGSRHVARHVSFLDDVLPATQNGEAHWLVLYGVPGVCGSRGPGQRWLPRNGR